MEDQKQQYIIYIDYTTGDSFKSYDTSDILDYDWNNIEIVRNNLQRIKNHYNYVNENDVYNKPKGSLPEGCIWDDEYRIIQLELLLDNNKIVLTYPNWCGYFEHLNSIEIRLKNDLDKINF